MMKIARFLEVNGALLSDQRLTRWFRLPTRSVTLTSGRFGSHTYSCTTGAPMQMLPLGNLASQRGTQEVGVTHTTAMRRIPENRIWASVLSR